MSKLELTWSFVHSCTKMR